MRSRTNDFYRILNLSHFSLLELEFNAGKVFSFFFRDDPFLEFCVPVSFLCGSDGNGSNNLYSY